MRIFGDKQLSISKLTLLVMMSSSGGGYRLHRGKQGLTSNYAGTITGPFCFDTLCDFVFF